MALKYANNSNLTGTALHGATIKQSDWIFTDTLGLKTPISFGTDGVYPGKETYASGSPFWYPPANKLTLGGSVNGQLPNGLSAGSHTITVREADNDVVETATFTVGA